MAFSAVAIAALVLVSTAVALPVRQQSALLSFDSAGAKSRPVTKVIMLLKDIMKQLQTEADEDEEIYDKFACWCQTNDKEKSQTMKDAEAKIADLTTQIESGTAKSSRLVSEIENLEKEVQTNHEALDSAVAIREKQVASFTGEEKDMLASVSALKAAIIVLSKHHQEKSRDLKYQPAVEGEDTGAAFSQLAGSDSRALTDVMMGLRWQLERHEAMLRGVITPSQRRTLAAFVQGLDGSSQAPHIQRYVPQSSEIFGILRQMLDTFESNLSEAQKEELENQKSFGGIKAAKEAEITAGQNQLDAKVQDKALTDVKLAQDKQDIVDTRNSLTADEVFLIDLRERCAMTDKEWEERQKTRTSEMEAISEALSVLSADEAHDTFTKTFNPALLQVAADRFSGRREQVASLLLVAAKKAGNPRLATLATQVQLDKFTKVIAAIDRMIVELGLQKVDEVKQKDFCVANLHDNAMKVETMTREKQDVEAKKNDLTATIAQLTTDLETIATDIAEMNTQMKKAGEGREKANIEFQAIVADQRETQKLLKQAVAVLERYYATQHVPVQQDSESQLQTKRGPPPPPGFKEYKNSAGASGVVALITQIINEAKTLETEAIHAEETSQKSYEEMVKLNNLSIDKKNHDTIAKSSDKAKAEEDLIQAGKNLENKILFLEQLANTNTDLRQQCDFVVNNFDIRQAARDEEIEALQQAKAILRGADFQGAA